ncbi:MAG: hypothetical protein ACXW32_18090, partial [Limisphaerales bacterium]
MATAAMPVASVKQNRKTFTTKSQHSTARAAAPCAWDIVWSANSNSLALAQSTNANSLDISNTCAYFSHALSGTGTST